MRMSETTSEIATALAKAQGQIDDAAKSTINPHFRMKYADIAAVRAAIREPLSVNDLCIVQAPRTVEGGVEVETMIMHKSGEYMAETLKMPLAKHDAQGVGSAITYARRYGIMSMLCLASDDDDGNAAVESAKDTKPEKADPDTIKKLLAEGQEKSKEGVEKLRSWYAGLSAKNKKSIDPEQLNKLVSAAKAVDEATISIAEPAGE